MILLDRSGKLVSDKSDAELYAFAFKMNLRRSWMKAGKYKHYVMTSRWMKEKAIWAGAKLVTSTELEDAMGRRLAEND